MEYLTSIIIGLFLVSFVIVFMNLYYLKIKIKKSNDKLEEVNESVDYLANDLLKEIDELKSSLRDELSSQDINISGEINNFYEIINSRLRNLESETNK